MDINKTADGSKLTVEIAGRLDTTTAPSLETELKSSLDGVEDLVLDFKGLEYVSWFDPWLLWKIRTKEMNIC